MRIKLKRTISKLPWFTIILTITVIILFIVVNKYIFESKNPRVMKAHKTSDSQIKNPVLFVDYENYKEFERRRERVRSVCRSIYELKEENIDALLLTVRNMVIDMEHHLTWCPIYKAASTMWMKNFAELSGILLYLQFRNRFDVKYSDIVRLRYRRSDSYEKRTEQMNKTKKFMIVRHPFERLLSAYRDKLEHIHDPKFYYERYGKYIRMKYRKPHSNLTSLEPTFEEFLQYIATEKYFDEHWVPFYSSCQPCSIDYNYIIKFENLITETNILIKENNLEDHIKYVKDRKITSSQGITDELISKKYFRNIPKSLLLEIFKIYEYDFLLFNYSPFKYYSMSEN